MSETTQSPVKVVEIQTPRLSEKEQRLGKRLKRIVGTTVFLGAIAGGIAGWLDGILQEKSANERNHAEAVRLQKCADYISGLDLGKNSTIRVKSLPPSVREDCGLEYVPLKTTDGLGDTVGAVGTSGGFKVTALDTVLRYDEQDLALEINRIERDANDVAIGYSVIEGIGGVILGGMTGLSVGALLATAGEIFGYRSKPEPQTATQ